VLARCPTHIPPDGGARPPREVATMVQFIDDHREAFEVEPICAVEFATLVWVDWFNNQRLLGPIGDLPPAEFEALYYAQAKVA